jgi:uncharacterized protein
MQHKALRALDLKADGDSGVVIGRASVYGNVDSYGDRVLPGAFRKTLADKGGRVVVLSQHDPSQSIGTAELTDRPDGLHATIRLLLDITQAREDYARVKAGLVTGISIGYETVREKTAADGVRELHELRLWELSLVTFPANDQARVTTVKRAGDDTLSRLRALTREMRATRETFVLNGMIATTATLKAQTKDIRRILGRR